MSITLTEVETLGIWKKLELEGRENSLDGELDLVPDVLHCARK